MLWSKPIDKKVTITDEPPELINGNGIPVIGAIPIFMPTLMKTWNKIIAAIEPAMIAPYKFFESVIMRSARQISRA